MTREEAALEEPKCGGDTVSRQAASEAAVKMFEAWYGGSVLRDREIRARFDALPSAQQWIPVSERLPEAGKYDGDVARYYLVQNEYGDMMVCRWDGKAWEQIYAHDYAEDTIVAWMPLPEPWKGGRG